MLFRSYRESFVVSFGCMAHETPCKNPTKYAQVKTKNSLKAIFQTRHELKTHVFTHFGANVIKIIESASIWQKKNNNVSIIQYFWIRKWTKKLVNSLVFFIPNQSL